jgi:hypothetical protein
MAVARQFAKRILRGLGPIPAKVRPLLQAELERAIHAAVAVATLRERHDKAGRNVLVRNGWFKGPPPLTEAEWLALLDLFATGQVTPFHSFPELVRAVLRAGKIEVTPEVKVRPGWLEKRNAKRRAKA